SAFQVSANTNIYNQFIQSNNQFIIAPLATGQIYPQFPGNVIPASMIDPVAKKFMQFVPKQNTPYFLDANGILDDYVTYSYVTNSTVRYNVRGDKNFGDRNPLSFRWTSVPVVGTQANDVNFPPNGNTGVYSHSAQYMLSDTHILSASIVNELRLA